jgi:hypothetical protein
MTSILQRDTTQQSLLDGVEPFPFFMQMHGRAIQLLS